MLNNLQDRVAHLSPARRGLLLFVAMFLALFVAGFWAGFVAASLEHGHLLPRKPLAWVVVAVGIVATVAVGLMIRALLKAGLFTGMTGFDRRYWKMWLVVGLVGVPLGILSVMLGLIEIPGSDVRRLFGVGSIGPTAALVATLVSSQSRQS